MRINFDRLSQLAGLPASGNRRGLYEGKDHGEQDEGMHDEGMHDEGMHDEGMHDDVDEIVEEDVDEMYHGGIFEEEEDDADEMLDVDEAMLVQELRRAKRIMKENRRRSLNESRRRNMFEAQLKQVIDEEVQNVMDEMNLTGQWVYGDRRPTRSRKGYTNQGSMMPGIGFRRR